MKTRSKISVLLFALTLSLPAFAADSLLINGAGATFPYPIYSKWFKDYQKVDSSVSINYQSIGSGGGIRQLLDNTVDFGASDAPMTEEELQKSKTPILHIPTVLGAIVLAYNLPEIKKPINLTSEVLSDIYFGKITNWNDPKIAAANPGIKFPKDLHILPVYRSDGSGTTAVFTDYLANISPTWKEKVGAGKALNWPTGIGGKGNEGVAGLIKQTAGSIGYMEYTYAKTNNLSVASIQNKSGNFITPSTESASAAAAENLKNIPEDFRISITNPDGKKAYPIASFTYLLIYKDMPKAKGEKLVKFLDWALTKGQKDASSLHYAPLPKAVALKAEKAIKTIILKP